MAKYDDNEYEVVWEPIDDNSEIMNVPLEQLRLYYNGVISRYKEMTGKTDQEIKSDFEIFNPELYKFVEYAQFRSRIYFRFNRKSTVSDFIIFLKELNNRGVEEILKLEKKRNARIKYLYLDVSKIDDQIALQKYHMKCSNEALDMIYSITIPIYNKKAKDNCDDINELRLAYEEAFDCMLKTFLSYLPEEAHTEYLNTLDEKLSSEGKKLVRELINK